MSKTLTIEQRLEIVLQAGKLSSCPEIPARERLQAYGDMVCVGILPDNSPGGMARWSRLELYTEKWKGLLESNS